MRGQIFKSILFSLILIVSGCKKESARCGNGVVEGEEICDGMDFAGDTCVKHNFLGGRLTCSQDCNFITFEKCTGGCGNGVIEEVTKSEIPEECDKIVGQHNCQAEGYDYGTLKCNADCTLDYSECKNAVCGNGVIEETEECDFDNSGSPILNDTTCEDMGFNAGNLLCFPAGNEKECHFDTSDCKTWKCGNHVIDPGENCDFDENGNPMLDDETCVTRGYDFGELKCVPENSPDIARRCKFDVSECGEYVCGNGIVEGDEECEEGVTIEMTCQDRGFESGDLSCNAGTCTFDLGNCVGGCGNGRKEGSENCDGEDLGGEDCSSISNGSLTGQLGCKVDCTYDLSMCNPV